MHLALAPGEELLPGTRERLEELFHDARVAAVLVPLVPRGEGALQRAARRYLAAWDGRFLHPQNFFAPATRVATRSRSEGADALPASAARAHVAGPRNADAAPQLADALARGLRIEALRAGGVGCDIARDLSAWSSHWRAEGAAWGARAASEPEFARFAPAPWAKHNVAQLGRRTVEILQASRRPDPLVWLLHVTRESAYSRGTPTTIG
ncbi:MAG TPA: hypothetical protein VM370_03420 [Candidatus Thermoplasmatota archaeon]|nr:hypothetical protein [Candidatus Thermoplasmatota archaeon]